VKKRLDVLLVERGLAETRAQAQALVLAGRVAGYGKPGTAVDESADLVVERPAPYVSRGGEKLAHALDVFGVDPAGRRCLDVGASTGGFSDVLLQAGAEAVIALDVGRGQLHQRVASDPRVTVLEQVNARYLDCSALPFAPEIAVIDVSFISLGLVLGPVLTCLARPFQVLALVKPQFEAGRHESRRGVVRDPSVHAEVLRRVASQASELGAVVLGACSSGHPGPAGNREFFLHLVSRDHPDASTAPRDLDVVLDHVAAG
jgi:23S rRNA (cytidine1920-2'-O)/16S rRNA (cytidine1409-2'-O)-methyltransferase